jgi:hypothetical protein
MTDNTSIDEATTTLNTAETVSIPESSVPNSKDNPYRLCEYDAEAQIGCRRTNTIFALEAEYDTFVDPEMEWGVWDLYCRHDDKTYYYKNHLETMFGDDSAVRATDTESDIQVETDTFLKSFLAKTAIADINSLDAIRLLIQTPPGGFPKFVIETPQFFQFDNLGQSISIDDLDRPLLDKIKNTFTSDANPLLWNLVNRLFIKDNEIVCADLLRFDNNPTAKLGIIMVPEKSEKYDNSKAYFFAFSPLTGDQIEFANRITAMEADFQRPVEIINL